MSEEEDRWWEKFWQRVAKKDFMRRFPWHFTHPARQIVYEATKRLGDTVLDVGCGTGIDYAAFISRGIEYVGVDITPKFVSRFKEHHPEADVRLHSSLSLPFPDESFDVVYSGGMIQHMRLDEYPEAVRAMWRICRRGVILTTSNPFTQKNNVVRIVRKGRVYDNSYAMPQFLDLVHGLPKFEDVVFHKNIKHIRGDPYTVVIITKRRRVS